MLHEQWALKVYIHTHIHKYEHRPEPLKGNTRSLRFGEANDILKIEEMSKQSYKNGGIFLNAYI